MAEAIFKFAVHGVQIIGFVAILFIAAALILDALLNRWTD